MVLYHHFWGPHSTGPGITAPNPASQERRPPRARDEFLFRNMSSLARAAQLIP